MYPDVDDRALLSARDLKMISSGRRENHPERDSMLLRQPRCDRLHVIDEFTVSPASDIQESIDTAFDGEAALEFHGCGALLDLGILVDHQLKFFENVIITHILKRKNVKNNFKKE